MTRSERAMRKTRRAVAQVSLGSVCSAVPPPARPKPRRHPLHAHWNLDEELQPPNWNDASRDAQAGIMDAKTFSRWDDTAGSETGRQSKTGQSAAGAMAQDRRNKVRDDAPTRDHPEGERGARTHGESGTRRHGGADSGRAEAAPAAGADEAGSEGSAVWDSSDVAEVQEMEPIGPRASPAAERPLERLEEAAALGEALLEAAATVAPAATASSECPAPTCQETNAFV